MNNYTKCKHSEKIVRVSLMSVITLLLFCPLYQNDLFQNFELLLLRLTPPPPPPPSPQT